MIKCAAIKRGDLVFSMPQPARHHTIIHEMVHTGITPPLGHHGDIQGFLTETGDFVDRVAAFAMTRRGRGGKTFSEDLW